MVVKDGIGRATEVEDPVDPILARAYLTDPTSLLQSDLPVIKHLREYVAYHVSVSLSILQVVYIAV